MCETMREHVRILRNRVSMRSSDFLDRNTFSSQASLQSGEHKSIVNPVQYEKRWILHEKKQGSNAQGDLFESSHSSSNIIDKSAKFENTATKCNI